MNNLVALFPGQGSQHVGMAKDLLQDFKIARDTFEEASEAVKQDLRKLCLDGPDSDLTLTENTQPCLLTASVAAFRAAQSATGFTPALVAGHSLGEYSALVSAGVLPLATAVRWVKERGASMQKAVPAGEGSMAAILGMEDDQVEALCAKATENARAKRSSDPTDGALTVEAIVQPANFNAPGQLVVAGSRDAVAEAVSLIKAGEFAGGKAIPLQVSAPFHCKLMGAARSRMAELFARAADAEKPRAPICPYVPNRTARITREPGLVFELLVEQVDHPVLWKQSVTTMIQTGFAQGVEFGPGKVLQGLAKRIAQPTGKPFSMTGISDTTGVRAFEELLKKGPAA